VDAAVAGAGVARPYEIAARAQLRAGTLKRLMPDWSGERQPIYAVFPASRHVPAKVRAFVDFAAALLAEPAR
jgi:DNA-binding transcriptional LysR family regulator